MSQYQTETISNKLLEEISEAIRGKQYGSIEIYIEAGEVTQITERVIKKYRSNNPSKPVRTRDQKIIPTRLKTTVSS